MRQWIADRRVLNRILSLFAVLIVFGVISVNFEFYYDLNDDVVIKDILSGAFSGRPSGHTNQILYPLGWLIGVGYRLWPHIPVYGLFLLACMGVCIYLTGLRLLEAEEEPAGRPGLLTAVCGIFLSLFLWELVYVQYSVVCGMLSATACVWFYQTKRGLKTGEFWKVNLPALLLVWLAFLLRSEMLLLTTPFLAGVGIMHWAESLPKNRGEEKTKKRKERWKDIFSKNNCQTYLGFVLVMLMGGVFLWWLDGLGYRTPQWKEYRRFFDARTRVYDYTWYPQYEKESEFYGSIGLTKEQVGLIHSYNFGLDKEIDAEALEKLAAFGERGKNQGSMGERIKKGMREMILRLIDHRDAPYNIFLTAAYTMLLVLSFWLRDGSYLARALLLFCLRTIPWMYLLLAERAVDRVIHPLYFIEFLILTVILLKGMGRCLVTGKQRSGLFLAVLVLSCISASIRFAQVEEEQKRRQAVNQTMDEFQAYAEAHPDKYFLLDVYSTVAFSEKLLDTKGSEFKNYDLLGGWVCHSPLQEEKMDTFGKGKNLHECLLQDGFCFVLEADGDGADILDWYKARGIELQFTRLDQVGESDNPLIIYQLTRDRKRER